MAGNSSSGRPSETVQLALKGGDHPPQKPQDLTGQYANEIWDLALEALPHVLRAVDGPVLQLACLSYQRAMDCLSMLRTEPDNEKLHKQAVSAMTRFESLSKSIGLNPHSRRVIKPAAVSKDSGDDFSEWMKRGGLN